VWVIDQEDPFIYRKNEYPLQDSISKCENFFDSARFLENIGDRRILIPTEDQTLVTENQFGKFDFQEVQLNGNSI